MSTTTLNIDTRKKSKAKGESKNEAVCLYLVDDLMKRYVHTCTP